MELDSLDEFKEFETLSKELHRWETTGTRETELEAFAEATRVRKELAALEDAKPCQAVRWHMQRRVNDRTLVVLDTDASLTSRLEAVEILKETASPPLPISQAEDALHTALVECDRTSRASLSVINAIVTSLWDVWTESGDDLVDLELQKGCRLMEQSQYEDAVEQFSKVISMAPEFAEGWNKRATAYYLLQDFEASKADCMEALERKPRHFGCLDGLARCWFGGEARPDVENLFEGLKWFRKTLAVNPSNINYQRNTESLMMAILSAQQAPLIQRATKSLQRAEQEPAADEKELQREQEENLLGANMVDLDQELEDLKDLASSFFQEKDKQDPDKDEEEGEVTCDWNVHRVRATNEGISAGDDVFLYLFRLRYKNTRKTSEDRETDSVRSLLEKAFGGADDTKTSAVSAEQETDDEDSPGHPVESWGRYYVLQLENDQVFHFTRPTQPESGAQIVLNAGEEYTLAWMLILKEPLHGATGGTTFQRVDDSLTYDEGLTTAKLAVLRPQTAKFIDADEVEELKQGHYFSGYLDLRHISNR